jgi:hypothetical protein
MSRCALAAIAEKVKSETAMAESNKADPPTVAEIDARLLALAEKTARLTAAVKTRARSACCPKCGYYFTVEREDVTEPPPEPPRATHGTSATQPRQMLSRARLAAAMRSIAANPETDAQKIERLAASFAGDCGGLVVGAEEGEGDGRSGVGSGMWSSKVTEEQDR